MSIRRHKNRTYALMAHWFYRYWWRVTTKDWRRLNDMMESVNALHKRIDAYLSAEGKS